MIAPDVPYIRIRRLQSTLDALLPDGTIRAGAAHRDRLALVVPGDSSIETQCGLSVATHTSRLHAPRLTPQWCPDALVAQAWRGDPALCFFGFTPPEYVRGDLVRQDYRAELLIHNFEGRSDGCPTAPQPWIDAVIAYLDRMADDGSWSPRCHPDGRWTVGLMVEE